MGISDEQCELMCESTRTILFTGPRWECEQVYEAFMKYGVASHKLIIESEEDREAQKRSDAMIAKNEAANTNITQAIDADYFNKELHMWLWKLNQDLLNTYMTKTEAISRYVRGLHQRGLSYHFDDCAVDCLVGNTACTEMNAVEINRLTKKLHCEEMFELAIKLLDSEGNTGVSLPKTKSAIIKEYAEKHGLPVTDLKMKRPCTCNIRDIMSAGCRCGGV